MTDYFDDKDIERERYDSRSQKALTEIGVFEFAYGSGSMPMIFRAPYIYYEKQIAAILKPTFKVIELGSGSGLHTKTLLQTGAEVTATDIAPSALELNKKGLTPEFGDKLKTQVADMEGLPFEDQSFDVVASAGSLSYGELSLVTSEIKRVLKPGGTYICVDSFNHNPVYKLNRYLHYIRGKRSKSTLQRMPSEKTVAYLRENFKTVEVSYFGIFTFLGGLISILTSDSKAASIVDKLDKNMSFLKKHAFKIVIIARK